MKSEHIHQDNDWAMAPPVPAQTLWQLALDNYKKAVCEIELAHFHRISRDHQCKVARYFNSTANRRAFYYLMLKANYVKQPYSVSQISKALTISRQSATTLVQECLAEGWIKVCDCPGKHYQASKTLISFDDEFALKRLKRVQQVNYFDAANKLISCQELCQTT
jgi:hypothetical protein